MKIKIKTKGIFKILAVIGLLIFLHFLKILTPLENIIISFINPLASSVYSVGSDLKTVYNEQTDKRDFLEIIKNLEQETNRLSAENLELKVLKEENEKLRQYLKFSSENNFQYILANIIHRDFEKNEKKITINKGLKDGLRKDLGVVNSHGVIIGKIIEVKENISEVLLVSDSGCKLASFVYSENEGQVNKTSGITQGELGLTIKMDFISQSQKIKEQDIVLTSGLEKDIPRGLIIGTIREVNNNSNDIWQSAIIDPSADLDNLVIVSVVLP